MRGPFIPAATPFAQAIIVGEMARGLVASIKEADMILAKYAANVLSKNKVPA